MFAEHEIRIQVDDTLNTELVFPVSLVNKPDTFDALMADIATCIEQGPRSLAEKCTDLDCSDIIVRII